MFSRTYRTSATHKPDVDHQVQMFSIRFIKYVLVWLVIWQDNSVSGSPLQYFEYLGNLNPFHPFEVIVALCVVVLVIERLIIGDYTVKRSYFYGPLIVIGLALFLSWARGAWIRQETALVFEIHEAFLTPFEFFIFLNLFRDKHEWRTIILLMITASVAKSFDGIAIYLFAPAENKAWGTLMLWRDGYLLAIGITSMVLLLYYKGKILRWLKWTMICSTPVIMFALITSYRRTFYAAIMVNLLLMFILVGKGNRLKHLRVLFTLLIAITIFILATDPVGFITRVVAGVITPGEEGSAYVRLMELPNVLLNIYHNPIFGTAIGTQWHQYIRMPLFANYTTLGTHNSYLYWPLRTGLMGTLGFWWMIVRIWRVVILQLTCTTTEEDRFFAQMSFFMIVTYMVGSFFGLMYGDTVTVIIALHMVSLQLFIEERFGIHTLKNIWFLDSVRQKRLVYRYPPVIHVQTSS